MLIVNGATVEPPENCDVVIAGLGPTGAMLANLLGQRGWAVVGLDREADRAPPYDRRNYIPTRWAGARLPSGFRDDGTALFDLLDARGFSLLVCGDDEPTRTDALQCAAADVGVPLQPVRLTEPHLARMYARKYVLVRPDRHVAWRGDALPDDLHALLDTVRGV